MAKFILTQIVTFTLIAYVVQLDCLQPIWKLFINREKEG